MEHFPSLKRTFPQLFGASLSIVELTLSYHSQHTADIPKMYQSRDGFPILVQTDSYKELDFPF